MPRRRSSNPSKLNVAHNTHEGMRRVGESRLIKSDDYYSEVEDEGALPLQDLEEEAAPTGIARLFQGTVFDPGGWRRTTAAQRRIDRERAEREERTRGAEPPPPEPPAPQSESSSQRPARAQIPSDDSDDDGDDEFIRRLEEADREQGARQEPADIAQDSASSRDRIPMSAMTQRRPSPTPPAPARGGSGESESVGGLRGLFSRVFRKGSQEPSLVDDEIRETNVPEEQEAFMQDPGRDADEFEEFLLNQGADDQTASSLSLSAMQRRRPSPMVAPRQDSPLAEPAAAAQSADSDDDWAWGRDLNPWVSEFEGGLPQRSRPQGNSQTVATRRDSHLSQADQLGELDEISGSSRASESIPIDEESSEDESSLGQGMRGVVANREPSGAARFMQQAGLIKQEAQSRLGGINGVGKSVGAGASIGSAVAGIASGGKASTGGAIAGAVLGGLGGAAAHIGAYALNNKLQGKEAFPSLTEAEQDIALEEYQRRAIIGRLIG